MHFCESSAQTGLRGCCNKCVETGERTIRLSGGYATATDEMLRGMNIFFSWETPMKKIVACAAPLWLAKFPAVGGIQQAVSHARHLSHFCHVVHAYDVRPAKNAGGQSRGRGPKAFLGGR